MAVTAHRTSNHAKMYGFARHATGYDLLSGVLARPLYRRVVADVIERALPDRSVVLDVGTGPGRVVRLIAAACPTVKVTGIDLSPEMIARATSTAKSTSTRNLRFEVADVAQDPVPPPGGAAHDDEGDVTPRSHPAGQREPVRSSFGRQIHDRHVGVVPFEDGLDRQPTVVGTHIEALGGHRQHQGLSGEVITLDDQYACSRLAHPASP